MNQWGTPDFKDVQTPVGNPLRYARRVVLQILESALAEPHLFTPKSESPYLYKADPVSGDVLEDSKVVIADTYADELEKTEPRPVLLVSRGDFGFMHLSIGGRRNQSYNMAVQQFVDMTETPVIVNCISRRDTEAEDLAWIVVGLFRMFKFDIKKQTQLFKISDPRAGTPAIIKADSQADLYAVPVSMVTHLPVSWSVIKQPQEISFRIQVYAPNETEPFVEVP